MMRFNFLQNFSLLVIFCMPLYLVKMTFFGLPLNVFELLALFAIIFIFITKRPKLYTITSKLSGFLIIGMIFIIIGMFFSIIFNTNMLAGFGIFKSWLLLPIFFSLTLFYSIESIKDLEKIFLSVYFSAVLVGLIAIVYKLLGLTTYDNRLSSIYASPNHLAMYLAPGLFLGLYFLSKNYSRDKFSKKTLFYLATLMIILIPFYFTYSYGAWLASVLSLATTLFALRPNRKSAILLTSFLIICLAILLALQIHTPKFSAAINFSDRSSFASRQTIWHVSTALIEEHYFLGIGPGNFQSAYLSLQKNYPPYLEWAVPEPHNVFLAFWLQAGLLGLVGFLMLLFFVFNIFYQIIRNKKNTALAAPLLGFFLYTILHGLIDTTYWKNDLAFLFWVNLFLVLILLNFSKKTIAKNEPF